MSEKYTIVQHEKRLHWLKDCPVLLQSYALTKNNTNNSIFLQCKFENIADKSIKAMNIAVKCSDVSHQELADVDNFPYLDINVQPYVLFGDKTPVALPNNTTRNVRIIPLKVIFSDDTTWENTSERAYELAEYKQQPISSLGELADQYKRDLHKICTDSEKHNYLPANTNGFTICGCGHIIRDTDRYCPTCSVDIEKLFKLSNTHILQEHLENYQTTQAKSQQQQKVKKRKLVRGFAVAGIVAVLAITISLTYSHVKKNAFMKAFEQAQAYSDRFSACETFAGCITDNGSVILTDPYKDIQLDANTWHDVESISTIYLSNYGGCIHGIRTDNIAIKTNLWSMETEIYDRSKDTQAYDIDVVKTVPITKYGAIQLMENGTISSEVNSLSQLRNIVDIDKCFGDRMYNYQVLATLSENGTVQLFSASHFYKTHYNTDNWKNVIQISGDKHNLVGLCKDGTVVVTGTNDYGQYDAEEWTDIVAVKATQDSIYGIKSDGTIVGVGYIPDKQNYDLGDLKLW